LFGNNANSRQNGVRKSILSRSTVKSGKKHFKVTAEAVCIFKDGVK